MKRTTHFLVGPNGQALVAAQGVLALAGDANLSFDRRLFVNPEAKKKTVAGNSVSSVSFTNEIIFEIRKQI